MINLTTANNALKTVYLDVLDNMLNVSVNPLFSKIKKSSEGVYGKEIKVMAPYGLNGGVNATSEDGSLPAVGNNNYINLTSQLKNLYGVIEISDKAVRASQNSAGAFVNLLNDEMEGLIRSSAFNLSRMLYSDGRGHIAKILGVENSYTYKVDTTIGIFEGMLVDVYNKIDEYFPTGFTKVRVEKVDRINNTVTLPSNKPNNFDTSQDDAYVFTVQGSLNNEITGIDALFAKEVDTLYGVSKSQHQFMNGSLIEKASCDEIEMVKAIDFAEEVGGSKINYIACSTPVRRMYQSLLKEQGRNIQTIDIGNGFKGLDFYGIPMVSDRFITTDSMYFLDTDAFTLHQMCDWEWLTDDGGNVLRQKPGYSVYTATLVKYADLLCTRPMGQAKIENITSLV